MLRSTSAAVALVLVLLGASLVMVSCGGNQTKVTQAIDDATLSTKVKTALLNQPDVGVTQIDVETVGGVVTLSGTVKSQDEEQKAIAAARQVPGVKDVKSVLRIQPAGPPTSSRFGSAPQVFPVRSGPRSLPTASLAVRS